MGVLSIIIPAYNEEKSILQILRKIEQVSLIAGMEKEIIIIDDYSSDNTVDIVREYINTQNLSNIKLLSQDRNQGKGAALRRGFSEATGDYVIIQDADLEYDPNEYNLLLQPILDGFADVVYGSRFMGGKPHRILFFWHSIGNKFLSFLSNMFTNLNLTDMETCYKMYRKEILDQISLKENRFGIEPELTAKMSKIKNVRVYEVGISYYGRTYEEGKKIGWRDGLRAIYCIVKYNLFS